MTHTTSSLEHPSFAANSGPLLELSEAEFLELNKQNPWRTLSIGSRLRSRDVLDRLANEATDYKLGWSKLRAAIERDGSRSQLRKWHVPSIIAAVLLACVLDPEPNNFKFATRVLHQALPDTRLSSRNASQPLRLAVQIAAITRSAELFEELAKYPSNDNEVVWSGRVDLMRPDSPEEWNNAASPLIPTATFRTWWSNFNQPFTDSGLAPFHLHPQDIEGPEGVFSAIEAPLVAPASTPLSEQELVTVIVPTYNPEKNFLNTIRSLTRQSWSNIEVLVVDDCSTEGHEFLDAAASSDPRVRVISQETNGGAYQARNTGLREARGAFVTFQDADDLSHPQRIERQILPLRNSSLIASTSQSQRVLTDGTLTYFGYLTHRVNASSLMFRRIPVLEQLGQFDAVRKGADSEFTERLLKAFGDDALVKLGEPLSLVQLTFGSLSRSDFFPGWMSGSRLSYLRQFRAAHRSIAMQTLPDWRISEDRPAICRSAPGMRGIPPAPHIPAAVVADWGAILEAHLGIADRIRELFPQTTETIGLLNGVHPRFSLLGRTAVRPEIASEVESGSLAWMNWADETHIGTLVFESPEYLWAFPSERDSSLTVDRVHIVLNEPLRATATPQLPPASWCEDRVLQRFGVRPHWRVSAPEIFEHLKRHGSSVEFLENEVLATRPKADAHDAPDLSHSRLTIGVALPARANRANWNFHALLAQLPNPSIAETVFYNPEDSFAADIEDAGLATFGRIESNRIEFLRGVDVLLPDLWGQRLIGTESWLRDCNAHGVAPALPYGFESLQRGPVLRYAIWGTADFLSALAVAPNLSERLLDAAAAENQAERHTVTPALRFLILDATNESDAAATEASVLCLENLPGPIDIIKTHTSRLSDLPQSETFLGLPPDSRVCIVRAGTLFEPNALRSLSHSAAEDIHVFSETSYPYALNTEISGHRTVVANEYAPLWAGSTPLLIRTEVLATIIRQYPNATATEFVYAAALSLVGGFGVLGGVRSASPHEDQERELSEASELSWSTDLLNDWKALLANTRKSQNTRFYLQRIFVYLLLARGLFYLLSSSASPLDDAEQSAYDKALAQALSEIDSHFLLPEPRFEKRIEHFFTNLDHSLTSHISELRLELTHGQKREIIE